MSQTMRCCVYAALLFGATAYRKMENHVHVPDGADANNVVELPTPTNGRTRPNLQVDVPARHGAIDEEEPSTPIQRHDQHIKHEDPVEDNEQKTRIAQTKPNIGIEHNPIIPEEDGWTKLKATNCYNLHGAQEITDANDVDDLPACKKLCQETVGCKSITIDEDHKKCYLRNDVNLKDCESVSGWEVYMNPNDPKASEAGAQDVEETPAASVTKNADATKTPTDGTDTSGNKKPEQKSEPKQTTKKPEQKPEPAKPEQKPETPKQTTTSSKPSSCYGTEPTKVIALSAIVATFATVMA